MKINKILLIMKLTVVIMIFAFLQVSAHSYSQKITISQKNASLEDIFKEIRVQSGYNFLYTAQMLEGTKPVSIRLKNAGIREALQSCLSGQPLSYTIRQNTVVIKRMSRSRELAVQADSLRGVVTDSAGMPLPGVSVMVKGTQQGTSTDLAGRYALYNVPENATLVYTFL